MKDLYVQIDRLLHEKSALDIACAETFNRLNQDFREKGRMIESLITAFDLRLSYSPVIIEDIFCEPAGTEKEEEAEIPYSVEVKSYSFEIPQRVNDELMIYIDNGFFSDWGHYISFATLIHEEAKKRDVDLWHFSTDDVSEESAHRFSLMKLFRYRALLGDDHGLGLMCSAQTGFSFLDAIEKRLFDEHTNRVLLSFQDATQKILDALVREASGYKRISLYMYTSHPLYIALFAEMLGLPEYKDLNISVHLCLFYLHLEFCSGKKVPEYESLLGLTSESLEKHDVRGRIKIYADSERTLNMYASYFRRQIHPSPIPLNNAGMSAAPQRRTPANDITIGFFGFAHEKQGYHLFKELYDALVYDKKYAHVNFVVRHNTKFSTPHTLFLSMQFLKAKERVVHLAGNFLPPDVYERRLDTCDIVAIPHSREYYPCQTSGLFTNALMKEKIVIVPGDTWMEDQLKEYGAGRTFESDNAASFIDAVKEVIDNFTTYSSQAARNVEAFRRFHTVETLLDTLEIGKTLSSLSGGHKISRESREPVLEMDTNLSRFKNIHKGERCFIVGNGPSLNKMDLNKLKDEYVFCTNAFFLMFPRISWRPQYYTCVDTRVLPDRTADIIKMHEENPDMVCFFPQQLIDHQTNEITPTEKIIPPAHKRIYFAQRVPLQDNLPFSAFSIEADKHLVQPYTVSITVLQLAFFLGFEPMYLIGCDTDYKVPATVEKEGEATPLGKMFYTSTADDDPNHFSPDYFGKGRKWHNPQVENMIWHYMMAHETTAICGRHIYNATVGGKLEVFPRVNFDGLFG